MIVVDVGCAKYGGDESIPYLVEEFQPDVLYGFDPAAQHDSYCLENTRVIVAPFAAWTYDGMVGFRVAGLTGRVDILAPQTPCIDLAQFILGLGVYDIALKIDAEGAEYELLPHLLEHGVDLKLRMAWVEWHCLVCGRGGGHREGCADPEMTRRRAVIEGGMRCEMHQWNR